MAGTISILDNAPRLVIAETGEISVTIASTQGPAGPGTAPEGTAIKSTGETGGTKFLREDGDGTCSWQEITVGGDLLAANNLSDLVSASTARTNLGLGTAATSATGDFATAAQGTLADSSVQPGDALSSLDTTVTGAQLNTIKSTVDGLGTASTAATGDFATAAQGTLADSAVQPGDALSSLDTTVTGAQLNTIKSTVDGLGTASTAATGDFATAAQGTLADSAVQPGDNISGLTNDTGFIVGVEGTEVASTGELGGVKFLREDGDGTCSWQTIPGGGDLLAANNLSDLVSASAARTNLGLGTAATAAADDFATAAQGTLADSSVQPGDALASLDTTVTGAQLNTIKSTVDGLGTASTAATGDFATAAQGTLADSSVQPGDALASLDTTVTGSQLNTIKSTVDGLGTASTAATGDFATAAQGTLADSSVQLGDALASFDTTVTGTQLNTIKSTVDGLATVAATGDYDDLFNKPTIPSAARRGIFLAGTIEAAGEYHAVAESDVTLAAWQLTSGDGTSGSVTLDVWVTTDGSTPTNANSITNGNEPALSSDDFATGTTSGFSTTSISRGDRFVVKVDSLTTITDIYFSLTGS
jgi:hypothetical protein